MSRESMIERFEECLLSVNREGIGELLEFIRNSDFYTAPASTRFHGSYEGGLLEHSLNVYDCLVRKYMYNVTWSCTKFSRNSIIITSLLHDLCKTNYYTIEMRNAKNEKGQWVKVPFYKVEDKIPYGHGAKSVMIAEQYIPLFDEERFAIRWHMGAYDVTPTELNSLGLAMEMYPLVLALHEADMEATHIIESEENKYEDYD